MTMIYRHIDTYDELMTKSIVTVFTNYGYSLFGEPYRTRIL